MPAYLYYFVKAIGKHNFLLRVAICESTLARAAEVAEAYVGSPNFKIEEATLENIFGNVVDLVPVIVTLN